MREIEGNLIFLLMILKGLKIRPHFFYTTNYKFIKKMLSEALYDALRGKYRSKKWHKNGLLGHYGGGNRSNIILLISLIKKNYFGLKNFIGIKKV